MISWMISLLFHHFLQLCAGAHVRPICSTVYPQKFRTQSSAPSSNITTQLDVPIALAWNLVECSVLLADAKPSFMHIMASQTRFELHGMCVCQPSSRHWHTIAESLPETTAESGNHSSLTLHELQGIFLKIDLLVKI
jgi:hypothetical protein